MSSVVSAAGVTRFEEASFDDWLNGRIPQHLSTNAGTTEVAFQGWRNFKEAFAPELIAQAFEETSEAMGRTVTSCLDPFGGSGTTSLACQFLGVKPTTIEVNPYLADLIEAKLETYDLDRVIRDLKKVTEAPVLKTRTPFPGAPATFVEPGINGRYIFSKTIANRLASLRDRILSLRNAQSKRLFRVLLGGIAVPVSNIVVSGKGRRYRQNWTDRSVDPKLVYDLFSASAIRAVYEIRRYQERKERSFKVLKGDARRHLPTATKFDLSVFSPPYPNSFDYTDVYNVELWICGYLRNSKDNRSLRLATLRSHVQIGREYENPQCASGTLRRVLKRLEGVRNRLWDQNIPLMIGAYFADMEKIMIGVRDSLNPFGRVYIVVGDSQYAGIKIPVGKILSELAEQLGYELAGEEPFRSMRASPQQGGRHELNETLLTMQLRKDNSSRHVSRRCCEKHTTSIAEFCN